MLRIRSGLPIAHVSSYTGAGGRSRGPRCARLVRFRHLIRKPFGKHESPLAHTDLEHHDHGGISL
jgi:hypothetical protein